MIGVPQEGLARRIKEVERAWMKPPEKRK